MALPPTTAAASSRFKRYWADSELPRHTPKKPKMSQTQQVGIRAAAEDAYKIRIIVRTEHTIYRYTLRKANKLLTSIDSMILLGGDNSA